MRNCAKKARLVHTKSYRVRLGSVIDTKAMASFCLHCGSDGNDPVGGTFHNVTCFFPPIMLPTSAHLPSYVGFLLPL